MALDLAQPFFCFLPFFLDTAYVVGFESTSLVISIFNISFMVYLPRLSIICHSSDEYGDTLKALFLLLGSFTVWSMIIQTSSLVEEPVCLSGKVLNLLLMPLMNQDEVRSNKAFSFTYQLVAIFALSAGS